uniref:EZH inhibitory protein n=1 Tax=Bos indicus x Bos taurus TaxID=30522 RepID=A0A4W2HJU1_BOBOX
MATQSCLEKEQKPQQGEMPTGPNNEVASAPGDARGAENTSPGDLVPVVLTNPSLLGSSSCDMATTAILLTGEEPGESSVEGVQGRGGPDLQGGKSPHVELSCVVPQSGPGLQMAPARSGAAVGQAAGGIDQHFTQIASPGKGRGRKRLSREEAATAQNPPRRCLFPVAAVPSGPASTPGLNLRGSPASTPGPARRRRRRLGSTPGPDHPGRPASTPGPARRRRLGSTPGPDNRGRPASVSGPARRSRPASTPGPDLRGRPASTPGPARRRRRRPASTPGPDHRGCPASTSGPARRRRRLASTPGPDHRGRSASMPGPAGRRRRSSASRRRACGPGPALSSGAVGLGPRLQSRSPTSGSSLRGRATQRRSPPTSCASPVGPNGGGRPSAPGFAGGGLPRQSSSSSLESEVPSLTTQQVWHAVRMRASSPSPPGRVFTFPREYAENSSVSSSSNSPGSIPSSASFSGVGSIATSSPPGVRRMLLPELEALSPLSSEEPAEEGSPPPSPPSPVL